VSDEGEIEKRVMSALESVDMAKYRKRIPTALSGGQQQRVAIARAIVKNPTLILADEPTGNLDEQNTVMVMDLLKAISRERLVLIVTHEAHLVDSYCDKVIGIADGRIVEERDNEITEGYHAQKTNEVYLGDMEREELSDGGFCFEYYGSKENKPTKIRIIESGGTLYISADEGAKLRLADASSELIVHEGKYVEKPKAAEKELPEVLRAPLKSSGKLGRMYTLKGAIKSGYQANFRKGKKRKGFLIAGMLCFSAIIVFVFAFFGTAVYEYLQVEQYFNSHTVAVSGADMSEEEAREIVASGKAEHYTITDMYSDYHPNVHENLNFSFGDFETSLYAYNNRVNNSNIHPLPARMLEGRAVVEGVGEIKSEDEIIITKALADKLIETAATTSLSDYRDLLYASAYSGNRYYGHSYGDIMMEYYDPYAMNGQSYRVVGIVEGEDEEAFYHDYAYLQKQISMLYGVPNSYISDLEHSGVDLPTLEKGSIYVREGVDGEKFLIAGKSYKIAGYIKVEVSDEMLEKYMQRFYGSNIAESLESYIGYMYGIYGFEGWLYQQKPGYYDDKMDLAEEDYAKFLESKEKEYNSFVVSVRNDCASSNYFSLPTLIMTREDMEDISITYSVGNVGGLSSSIYSGGHYVFYSYDVDALGEELVAEYGEDNVTTTKIARQTLRSEYYGTFVMLAIMLVIVCSVLSLCLYFIMRSALLGDIKEVGISRAIGVSRRNLCYRYFIETMVLFALTIFVGYLLTSWVMSALSAMGSGLMMIVYYPWWIALAALALIFAVTTICGQLPIRTLLRRTPAEILAKYDI
jgi:energy-coupling factor transporter ATP-binding protein EcfA2/ABC-type antimicrobial peptide transport system permease subunit